MFSKSVADELKYYVYRLIDPRSGETFYVGKGTGNRVFAHVKGELGADDMLTEKLLRIREIRVSGFEVAHVIHRHGMDEATAFEVEAAVLDAYPEATNLISESGIRCARSNAFQAEIDEQRRRFLFGNSYVPGLTSEEKQELDGLEHRQQIAMAYADADKEEQEYVRLAHAAPWDDEKDGARLAELQKLEAERHAKIMAAIGTPHRTVDEMVEDLTPSPWALELLMLTSKRHTKTDEGRKTRQAELAK